LLFGLQKSLPACMIYFPPGIFSFDLSQNSPPVMQLQLYLENIHMVSFHDRAKVNHVVHHPGVDRSILTTYFEANRLHEEARGILYRDFPEWYTLLQGKVWQRRKRKTGEPKGSASIFMFS
jgi:ATP-dependent DNA helicase PIF1